MTRGGHRKKRPRIRRDSDSSQPTLPPQSSDGDEEHPAAPSTSATAAHRAAVELSKREAKIKEFGERYDVDNKTNEQVLAAQMDNWSSDVYDHFHMPPGIVIDIDDDESVRYKFICRFHKGPSPPVLTRVRWDDSTSNLGRHVNACQPKKPAAGQAINDFAYGSTYTKAGFRYLLSLWVARRHRPFKIVQDPELVQLFQMLYSKVEIPSAKTVSRDIREIFTLSREYVAKQLQSYPGRLHLGIDGWTSPNVLSFLGVTIHYVVNAEMRSFILDFVKLTQNHTGKYLAEELASCLKSYGIQKKILGVTGDNATNNDTLVAELESLLGDDWYSMMARIRCLAHILNLIVKAILSLFAAPRRVGSMADAAEDEDTELMELEDDGDDTETFALASRRDYDENGQLLPQTEDDLEVDPAREEADSDIIAGIIAEVEASEHLHAGSIRIARFAVTKLTQLAKRVFHSPAIREDLRLACERCNIEPKQMIRSVPTRWNSTSQAISRALYLRLALEKLFALPKYDKNDKKSLKRFKPSPEEWTILEQLEPVLEMFLVATEHISRSNHPLLHEVIPIIDKLTTALEHVIANNALVQPVRAAATRGMKVLNKYYSATDDSIMYRLAILLHPKYKTEYFKRQRWPSEWISTATDLLRERWESHYKPKASDIAAAAATAAAQASANELSSAATSASRSSALRMFEDDAYGMPTSSESDALEEYLSAIPVPSCTDPLQWWTSQLGPADKPQNPLARMALDFLSAPATSTDVERSFSRGSLTVTKRRHGLGDESVRAATVLSSWADISDMIPEAKIVEVFKAKSKRTKPTTVSNIYDDDGSGYRVSEPIVLDP